MGLGLKSTICGVHSYSTVFDVWQPCDWLGPNEKGLGAASMGLSLVLCHVLKDYLSFLAFGLTLHATMDTSL